MVSRGDRANWKKVREKSGFLSRKDQGFFFFPSWLQILEQCLHSWVSIFLHSPIFPPQIKYLRRNLRSHRLWPLTPSKWLQCGSSLVQQHVEGLTGKELFPLKLDFSGFQNSYHLPPTIYHWTYLQWHGHFPYCAVSGIFFSLFNHLFCYFFTWSENGQFHSQEQHLARWLYLVKKK